MTVIYGLKYVHIFQYTAIYEVNKMPKMTTKVGTTTSSYLGWCLVNTYVWLLDGDDYLKLRDDYIDDQIP